jgi:hypothetical protein
MQVSYINVVKYSLIHKLYKYMCHTNYIRSDPLSSYFL